MNEFEEKLESILSNPQAMEQIMSLAQSLGNGPSASPAEHKTEAPPSSPFADGPGQIDPRILTGIASLLSQSQTNDEDRVALLRALRPFVKESRYAKLDKAIQIARLSRLIRMAVELFRTKEDSHV